MEFVKLKMLCEFEKGSTGLAKAEPGEYPLVTTGAKRKTCNTFQFDTKAVCIPLVSSTGHGHASLKNVHYQEGMFALGSILVALTSKDGNKLDIQFLHLYLSQLKNEVLVPLMSGAANVALSVKKIQNIEIPLPSIERQREIVERFKSIVIEEDELKAELTHQKTLLKKLRQQILQDAIEGKLTADWRTQNPDIEPANELLKRIAAEKEQLIKDKKIKAQKTLPTISEEEKAFELPQRWEWCRYGQLMLDIEAGKSPVCMNYPAQIGEWGVLKISAISWDKFQENENKKLKIGAEVFSDKEILKGDFIMTRANTKELVAKSVIVGDVRPKLLLNDKTLRVRFINAVHLALMNLWNNSEYSRSHYISVSTGASPSMKNISRDNIKALVLPLPPFQEQQIIVTKVEKFQALCDQLEDQISQNQIHAEQLMQVVLKEAFNHTPEKVESINVQPPENIIPFKPKGVDYYKRTLLAAEIVHQLHKEPTLGHLKLQKLIYLCQKTESMQLPTQFSKQVAGPYDNRMARSIDKQLKDKKWFSYNKEENPKYKPLEKAGDHQTDFDKYFFQQKDGIHALIRLFRKAKSDQLEIVATLYACWEGILMKQEPLSEDLLVQRFYEWSEEKSKYDEPRIHKAIEWMRNKDIVPDPEQIAHA